MSEQKPGAVEQYVLDHEAPLAWDEPDEVIAFFRAHDAEDAQIRKERDVVCELLADTKTELREREALLARLVSALKAGRGTHGELCSDWENCQFIIEADAALAAVRAAQAEGPA